MAKQGIHPKYYEATVTNTTTGESFKVGSTKPEIKVDIFLKDHPYSTGKASSAKQAGRVQKFNNKFAKFQK